MEDNGGGGVFNNGGTLRLRSSNVTQNAADGSLSGGGGVFSAGGFLSVIDSSVSDTQASLKGGGVELSGGDLFVRGATIDSNAALLELQIPGDISTLGDIDGNGGGIHVSASNASIFVRDTLIAGNMAGGDGGGIWNQAGSTFRLVESQVSNNTAVGDDFFSFALNGGRGGGIFNNGGTVSYTHLTLPTKA